MKLFHPGLSFFLTASLAQDHKTFISYLCQSDWKVYSYVSWRVLLQCLFNFNLYWTTNVGYLFSWSEKNCLKFSLISTKTWICWSHHYNKCSTSIICWEHCRLLWLHVSSVFGCRRTNNQKEHQASRNKNPSYRETRPSKPERQWSLVIAVA